MLMMNSITRLGVAATIILARSAAAGSTCYYPSGTISTGDTPCTNEEFSACCGSGAICLDNGYCLSVAQPFTLSRASCTDINWDSSNCPSQCTDTLPDEGVTIILQNFANGVSEYCCNTIVVVDGDDTPACYDNTSTFKLDNANIIAGVALLANYTSESASTSTAAGSSTGTAGATATSTGTSSSASSVADSSSDATSSSSSSNKQTVEVGASVGVILGVASIAALAWAFAERRKRRSLEDALFAMQQQQLELQQKSPTTSYPPPGMQSPITTISTGHGNKAMYGGEAQSAGGMTTSTYPQGGYNWGQRHPAEQVQSPVELYTGPDHELP
ncbi:hypothetical protein BX600DRAFT_62382 [Xylariales sp. PMI_506]|nr:hypothetical protein BX600DRAFT_62382 [Xylariales sp. PMI_506]